MQKKSLLLLFIFSFLCVIFTLTNLCFKYVDTRVDNTIKAYTAKTLEYRVEQDKSRHIKVGERTKLVVSLFFGCTFLFVFTYATDLGSMLMFILFLIAYFAAYKLCLNQNITLSLFSPVLSTAVAKIFANTYNSNFRDNLKQKMENMLGKYISKDISAKILKNRGDVELGGKRAQISVMFADIRGFTSLSETRSAEDVSALLNEYFTEIEPIIAKYDGVINKFIGDAVLVIFGDPTPDKEHALKAVKCAYELRKKVKEIRERWICEGKPKIDIGIGINTGEAFIGNVGSSNRFEYTVIGDTVNIASRIEDYNKICKTNILISENTYNKISKIVDVIKIREVAIKGKRNKINIYEVLRITE